MENDGEDGADDALERSEYAAEQEATERKLREQMEHLELEHQGAVIDRDLTDATDRAHDTQEQFHQDMAEARQSRDAIAQDTHQELKHFGETAKDAAVDAFQESGDPTAAVGAAAKGVAWEYGAETYRTGELPLEPEGHAMQTTIERAQQAGMEYEASMNGLEGQIGRAEEFVHANEEKVPDWGKVIDQDLDEAREQLQTMRDNPDYASYCEHFKGRGR